MDVARILLALTFAVTSAGTQFASAAPQTSDGPVQHTVHFAGQSGWANPGPTTPPTITATPPNPTSTYDRYGYPQSAQTGNRTTAGPPPSITGRAQNAFSETATTLRDGIEAGVRSASDQLTRGTTDATQSVNQQFQNWPAATSQQLQSAGNSLRSAAEQSFGAATKKPQYFNPFAPAPAPQPTTTTPSVRKNLAPPPWPNSQSTTASTTTSQPWPQASPPAAPLNGNVSAPPANTQNAYSWNSNGANVAAPPPAASQQTTPNNNVTPVGNATAGSSSANGSESYRTQPSIHSPLVTTPQPTTSSAPARTTAPADNWASGWDTNPDTARASIGRSTNNASVANPQRNAGSATAQPSATISADPSKSAPAKSTDSWASDIWAKPAQTSQGGPAVPSASGDISKTAQPVAANNSNLPPMNQPPAIQPPGNSPALNLPTTGTAGNVNYAGAPANTPQATSSPVSAKPNQPAAAAPATGDEKPWVTFIVVILSLAGSLAANFFLGYSYIDARQKYQSLVRRTADTFHRTKAAAA